MSTINPTASYMYRKAVAHAFAGDFRWLTGTFKGMLLDSTYAITDTHEFVSDVSATEVTGSGYARVTLTTPSEAYTEPLGAFPPHPGLWTFLAANLAFGTITVAAYRWLVIFASTGTDSTSPLLVAYDYGAQSITVDTLTFSLSGGLFNVEEF